MMAGKRDSGEKTIIKYSYVLKFTVLQTEVDFQMLSQTESTRLPSQDRESENKFSTEP